MNSISNLDELKLAKRSSLAKIEISEEKLKAYYHIKKMDFWVPSIIRDSNNKIDINKGILHLAIAALPFIYNYLKNHPPKGDSTSKLTDLIAPLMDAIANFRKQ